jgi:hypothetical protein
MHSLSPGKMCKSTLYFTVQFFWFVVAVPVILFLIINQIVLGADEPLIRSNFAGEISRQYAEVVTKRSICYINNLLWDMLDLFCMYTDKELH